MSAASYTLAVTTQGPLYPPSEILNEDGNFVVVGRIPRADGTMPWAMAIVSVATVAPAFGQPGVHQVLHWLDPEALGSAADTILHTLPLPLPLPANNYPMLFAPEQHPQANQEVRASLPLHAAHIPDLRPEDGRRPVAPIRLGDWMRARS